MDFSYSEEQRLLANSLDRYLADHYSFAQRNAIAASAAGWSAEQWRAFAELGAIGALFDEAAGGYGGSPFDVGSVFAALGRALVVEPFLGALMAGRVLAKTARTDLVQQAIEGRTLLAFAHEEPQSRYDLADITTKAQQVGGLWKLSGDKIVIPQLAASDHIVVSARASGNAGDTQGLCLFLLNTRQDGVAIRDYPLIDGGRGGELKLDNAAAELLGAPGAAYPLIEDTVATGIVALCFEAVAIMDTMKEHTLEYLRTRKQFGVPIGKFQALQHRMATLALEIEQARSAMINAASALDGDRITRERAVSSAKYTIGSVGQLVAEEAIQMHGGIGLTWELPLSHYAKRLTMIGQQLGDDDHHLERYMALGRS